MNFRSLTILSTVLFALLLLAGSASADALQQKIEVNKHIQTLQEPLNPPNYALTTGEVEPNDDCGIANPYVDVMTGDLNPGGDEDWYHFVGGAGECVTIGTDTWNASTTDTQVYLYDAANCADPSAWLVWNDDGGPSLFSLIEDYQLPAAGDYYIRVKHYSSTGTGEYSLTLETASCAVAPENNLCDAPIRVDCNSTVAGTTDAATNDLEDILEVCVPYGADGPDVFYEVCVPPSHELTVTLTPDAWDPALWFVLDCNDETTCVAGDDAGFFNDPETISWINTDEVNEVCLYIIPDSYSITASGPFDLDIMCSFIVPTPEGTWGALKANY